MMNRDAAWRGELAAAGFEVRGRPSMGPDGVARYDLTGRGPGGAFVVSAPTMGQAYRAAVEQVRASATVFELTTWGRA